MRFSIVSLLVLVLLVALTLAQDSEDSTTPKRVLKKYRVRRPVVVDDQGNVVRAGPRLRRVRVKNPNKTAAETSTASPAPSTTLSTVSPSPSTGAPTPKPQLLRQRTLGVSPNAVPLERRVQPSVTAQPQAQPVFYEEQEIVEPVRTVPTYRQATSAANRDALLANAKYKPSRVTSSSADEDRKVGTTRNYSRINEDGSFTFGYEAEDGSFKEETRGVDCVVRGKYGYIDPEGVRREFEYVSGNPCDPNDPDKDEKEDDEEDDGLAPPRPILRQRTRPSAELSGNGLQQGQVQVVEERVPEDQLQQFVRPVQRQRRPGAIRQRVRITTPPPSRIFSSQQQQQQSDDEDQPALIVRQRPFPPFPSSRPAFQEPSQSLEDVQQPRSQVGRGLFNFDDEVHRLAAIARPQDRPQPLYEQPFRPVTIGQHQPSRQVFGNTAFHQELSRPSPTAAPTAATLSSSTPTASTPGAFGGRYRTELVYDPNSGQYTSVLVQSNPHSNQEFELTQKLRAFVDTTPSPSPSSPSSITPVSQSFPTPTFSTPTGAGAFTQIQQFGQPQIQYYHQSAPQGRSATSQPAQSIGSIDQFLARNAYQPQQQQQQPSTPVSNLQFIPPHLRPQPHQTAEIQRQEVRELSFSPSQNQGLGANSAAANGQIDAFLRALNISI